MTFEQLRLDGVSRSFGSANALQGLDLAIRRGEFVALLGPSGCGKSTALNCLAGLLPLTGGSIWLDDTRIDGRPPEQRGFGMVFQNYALFPHLSVRANVGFGLQMRKVARAELRRRVDEALRLVQLTEHAAKFPAQLSGGQQQRVAIARAVVLEPAVVLMDEPLSNLDAKLRLEMRMEIRRLHQTLGLTTVYVTHDQEEALSLADRLVVLREGTVQQIGTPEEVYAQPVNSYVASFMGYRNLLDLTLTSATGTAGSAAAGSAALGSSAASSSVTGSAATGSPVTVEGDGVRLTGTNRDDLTAGPAKVAIRPEDFVVGEGAENALDVTVEIVEYHGRELSVSARLANGVPVYFRTDKRLAPGDPVKIGVPAERVLVFAP
ncbi:ABC transporter ATP-binding protein [Amycolatopsis sp. NBC_01286]|uniref:ABC transporter ATP-binding protein n=1 Tax=Amycolatopsis sp. NBC_01286 TaxID=2903560 RepID=UPI002E123ACB|nr:ABC transporter ATP-binding protein [Amycolatopsis sp. NBC_01286]